MQKMLPPLLTFEEACEFLRCTPDELRIELEKGQIQGIRIGASWRIAVETLTKRLGLLIEQVEVVHKKSPSVMAAEECDSAPSEPILPPNINISTIKESPEVNSSAQISTSSMQSSLTITRSQEPPLGREWATVIAYNILSKEGRARNSEGKTVVFHIKDFLDDKKIPFPKDTIEFEPDQTRSGLKARNVRIVSIDSSRSVSKVNPLPTLTNDPIQPTNIIRQLSPKKISSQNIVSVSSSSQSKPTKAKIYYERASAAQNEQRYDTARQLYHQAISLGGGIEVYSAYYKMERALRHFDEAQQIIEQAIERFPEGAPLYDLYAQTERKSGNYKKAEQILRKGLSYFPSGSAVGKRAQLLQGLARLLVEVSTETSFLEAGRIYDELKKISRLYPNDGIYQRFVELGNNELAYRAFSFLTRAKFNVGIAIRKERNLPANITDLTVGIQTQEFKEHFGLSGFFLVRCFKTAPTPYEIVSLSELLQKMGARTVVNLISGPPVVLNSALAFVIVSDSSEIHDQILSVITTHDAKEVIVPIDKNVLNSLTPDEILVNHVGQYLGRRNLYTNRRPVWGKYFFGREDYLLRLTDGIKQGEFLGIYGLRKMGKTSLVRQLSDEKLSGEAVAFVDLQSISGFLSYTEDCTAVYWRIEQALFERIRDQYPQAVEDLQLAQIKRFDDFPYTGKKTASIFNDDLNILLERMVSGEIQNLNRIVIVLDELENILPISDRNIKGYMEFFQILRGISQTHPGKLSNVVVAANAAISERGYWEGKENPVFAFYNKIFLSPFSETECEQMIRELGKGMSVYWDDAAIELVYTETGGHPFLTRAFCGFIARKHGSRPLTVTEEIAQNQIRAFIYEEGDILEQIMRLVRENFPEDGRLLEEIALGKSLSSKSDDSLRHLMGYHLINEHQGIYKISVNLLSRWLSQQTGTE